MTSVQHRSVWAWWVGAALCILNSPLVAQGGDFRGDTQDAQPFTPDVRAPLRALIPAGFLSATSDKSEVQIEGGFQFPNTKLLGPLRMTLAATTPLNEDEDRTTLGGLSGLEAGTVLSLGIGGMRWRTGTQAAGIAVCERLQRAKRIPAGFLCAGTSGRPGQPGSPPRWDLLNDAEKLEINRALRGGPPILYEITGKLAREEFGYLEGTAYQPTSVTHTSRSIGGDVGIVFTNGTLLSAGVHYEFAYTGGAKAEVCVPLDSNGTLRCREGALEEPTSNEGTIVNLQIRRFFSTKVAINPQFRLRTDNQEWDFESPIYLATNAKGGLIGGVAPGYDSRDRQVHVRVFVGAAFRLGLPEGG